MASDDLGSAVNDDLIPKKKVGIFAPRAIVDDIPWEFYKLAPRGIMAVIVPLGLTRFVKEEVERVYAPVDDQLKQLMLRRVDLLVQSGVPLQCLIGAEAHDRRLALFREKTGLPATSGILGAIAACRKLGIRKIAFGNKFTEAINQSLSRFFTREGIQVTGYTKWDPTVDIVDGSAIKQINEAGLIRIGYEVGRKTFLDNPDCDGIYMPGGSWSLNQVVTDLEAEFGKPVLGHHLVNVWNIATHLGLWTPRQGLGRLYASPA